jgi:hypothetical protein
VVADDGAVVAQDVERPRTAQQVEEGRAAEGTRGTSSQPRRTSASRSAATPLRPRAEPRSAATTSQSASSSACANQAPVKEEAPVRRTRIRRRLGAMARRPEHVPALVP